MIRYPLLISFRPQPHDMITPVDSDYPTLIMEAAKTFANQCGAHAQVQLVEQEMKLCVQAPRIMQQFMGDVDFGKGSVLLPFA